MPTKMAPQPKLTVVNKVPNIPFVLLDLTQWIHIREATVLRHAMTARAKVICTSRILSIYNTHGRTGSDWGSDWGSNWGSDGGVELGVGLGGSDWGGQTGEVGLGSDEVSGKISQVSLQFADMSFDVDVVHPTCSNLGKVKFGSGKVTSRSVTVTAKAVTTS